MRKLKVMMKPTKKCNLKCTYCSAGEFKKEDMKPEIAIIAAGKIGQQFPERLINFTWGGGEPLLAGLDFYQEVVNAQKLFEIEKGYKFENMIQTNTTLITDEWAKFLKDNSFRVGISIDGPKHVNDKNRIFLNGKGTYDSIQKSMQILRRNDVRNTLLGVINNKNRFFMDESIDFMLKQKRPFKLYIATPVGRSEDKLVDAKKQEDLFQANRKIFDYWINTGNEFAGLSVKKYLQSVLTNEPRECTYLEDCQQHFMGIEPDGNVYPCACFTSDMKEFRYGNIVTDNLQDILKHPMRVNLIKRSKNLEEECREGCEHFSICHGGCPLKSYLAYGDINAKDYNCTQYRKLFSHIKERIVAESNQD